MEFFINPWVITIVGGVVVGLILYHFFDIGKPGKNIAVKKKPSARGELKIDLIEQKVSWDKYAISRWIWPSFKIVLFINNYHNNLSEYIKVFLIANSNDGIWKGTNFIFENPKNPESSQPNQEYRIEPQYKEKVQVFISSYEIGFSERAQRPNIDIDTLKLVIKTESGKTLTKPIKSSWIEG